MHGGSNYRYIGGALVAMVLCLFVNIIIMQAEIERLNHTIYLPSFNSIIANRLYTELSCIAPYYAFELCMCGCGWVGG